MRIGGYDQKITLRRWQESTHAVSGEVVRTVAESISVWARYRGIRGTEQHTAAKQVSKGAGSFYVRYREDVEPLLWDILDAQGRAWDIVGEPIPLGRRDELEIVVERRI